MRADQLDQQIGKVKAKLNGMQASLAKASGKSLEEVSKAVATGNAKSLQLVERYQARLESAQKRIARGASTRRSAMDTRQAIELQRVEQAHLNKYQKTSADVAAAQAKAEANKTKYMERQAYYVKKIRDSNNTPEYKASAIAKTKDYYGGLVKQSYSGVNSVKLENRDGREQQAELAKARQALFNRQRAEQNELRKKEESAQASLQKYVTQKKNDFGSTFSGAVTARGQVFAMSDSAAAKRKELAERKNEIDTRQREAAAARRAQQQQRLQQAKDVEFNKIKTGASSTTGLLAAGFAGFTASVALQKTAEYDQLKARVVNVSASLKEADMNMEALRRTSIITGQSMAGTVAMFARIAPAMKANNISNMDTLQFVNAFQNSLRASGTSMEQASAAAYQLSQSLSTGVLRGDELNSVMEGAPAFAMALANSLGKTMGGLKQLGEQGQLTTEVVSNAAKNAGPMLERMAKNVPLTPQQQLAQVIDRLVEAFSKLDKEYGILEKIGNMLKFVGDNASSVVATIKMLITALTTLYATNKIMGLVSAFGAAKEKLKTQAIANAAESRARVISNSGTTIVPGSVSSRTAVAKATSASTRAKGRVAPTSRQASEDPGIIGSLLSVFGLKILAATLVFEGLILAGAAFSAWFAAAPKYLTKSAQQLAKAEQSKVDAFDSGDIYKQDIADKEIDKARRERQGALTYRQRQLDSNWFMSDSDISEKETNRLELGLLEKQRANYAKEQEALVSGPRGKEMKLGDVLSMRGALGLDAKKGFGGVAVDKAVFSQLKSFDSLTKLLTGTAKLSKGLDAQAGLNDLTQGLSTLMATVSGSSDIAASIGVLNNSLASLAGNKEAFTIVGEAIEKLTDKLTDSIDKEITAKIETTTRRLNKVEKASAAVFSNQSRSIVFETNLRASQNEIDNYGSGSDPTADQSGAMLDIMNANRDEEKKLLNLRLSNVDKERSAKLQALDQTSKMNLKNIDDSEKRTIAAVSKYVKESEASVKKNGQEGMVDNARSRVKDLMYDAELLNTPTFVGTGDKKQLADFNQTEQARISVRDVTEKTISEIQRNANQERLALLVEYQKTLEGSIMDMLTSYENYTKKVIDLDRQMATKKLSNEKMVRDQKVANANDSAKIAFMQKKALGITGLGKFEEGTIPIAAAQEVSKKAQEKLAGASTEYDQRQAIDEVKNSSKELLDMQLESLSNGERDKRGNLSIATITRMIEAREEYMRVLDEANAKEKSLDMAQRNGIADAADNVGAQLDKSIIERDSVQAKTAAYSSSELAQAKGDAAKLNLRPDEESLASLRNTIQTALDSQPFTIRFDAADAQAAKASSNASSSASSNLQPVNMTFNGVKAPTVYTDSNNLNTLNAVVKTAVR